ncbi:MAG: SagB/ThcOx family dehydrogenase [Oculatellaceae cyanobacterium Prado106]|jgi:SagB-type dehydrogenase family enzyme|nr:SagB/ThcOx family dehydrogenase [Oculatellaceae cyanobacterium Prado106]
MLPSSVIQNEYHEATKHSLISVQLDPNYVDASTQPTAFKTYPHFFRRFPLNADHPIHTFLALTSAITYQKQYRDGVHALRVQPSAGALYPTELYVQIRGVEGLLDGLYHIEPQHERLTLLYELIDDGLEGYLADQRLIQGFIFLVTCVYFRSSWKYKNRSLRYCFLDSGHQVGAIEAAAYVSHFPYQLQFDFDQLALNDDLGFDTQEFATAMVVVGEPKQTTRPKAVRRLRSPLPQVPGTDYFEPNRFIESAYQETFEGVGSREWGVGGADASLFYQSAFPFTSDQWREAILQRRSARRFYPNPISHEAFLTLCEAFQQPIPSDLAEDLEIYAVVHRVAGLEPGLYQYPFHDHSLCLKPGEFHSQTGYLCIHQAIARDCAVVFFITSACRNYRVALQQAGIVGHRIYLAATALNIGCSGIGAYYDDETQAFLGSDRPVLYAIAIGQTTAPKLVSA